ncbi:shufflon-specific recombinase, partial [mine drainage metagenome]
MATILQLHSGRWQARVRRADAPATSRTFHTKFDAEAWARKQESEQERGVWRDSSESERTTLAQAFDRYAREVTPRKRAQNTERSNLRVLAEERIARLALARVGSHDIAALRDAWMAEGLKPASIKRRMVTLSHVFTVAAREWNMVGLHNPVRAITLVPENNARERRVTDAEIEAICAATGSAG